MLTCIILHILIFWVFMPCNIGGINQCFGGTYCLHLQGTSSTLKMVALSSQKINIWTFTAVKT